MPSQDKPLYYSDYLQLDKILDAQTPETGKGGQQAAHDEMLFIIVHQVYELWFKQMLHELNALVAVFSGQCVDDTQLRHAVHMLERVSRIQDLLVQQLAVLDTMTPLDFLDFRHKLSPASGFQSRQFREIESVLGVYYQQRRQGKPVRYQRLSDADRSYLEALDVEANLYFCVERWLENMPFLVQGDFDFWHQYEVAIARMLADEQAIILANETLSEEERKVELSEQEAMHEHFDSLLDKERFSVLSASGVTHMSQQATLSALFIHLYRDAPILQLPFKFLTLLVDLDESLTTWRYRHALMAHRMIGHKIGTGGSAGHNYLRKRLENSRLFIGLFNLSTFLIPHSCLPQLPEDMRRLLGFHYDVMRETVQS